MSKIIRFTAENVKKIKAIEIFPEDLNNVVIITGKNAQGKSSVIESLWMALAGFKYPQPVNNTKTEDEESYVEIELEDLIIRRHWTSNEKSYLNVLTKDGAKYPSPQAMLDKMKGAISLDPVEFMMIGRFDKGEQKQVEYLIKALNLNTKTYDIKYKVLYDERQVINRDLTKFKSILKELPEPEVNLPDKEISVLEITGEMQRAIEHNQTKTRTGNLALQALEDSRRKMNDANRIEADIQSKHELIKKLQNEINALDKTKITYMQQSNDLKLRSEELYKQAENIALIDIDNFQMQINEAEKTNQKIRARNKRTEIEAEADELFAESEKKTGEMEEIKRQKAELISRANFPIEGLTYDENGIFVNGIPLVQLSESEQFRFSALISMVANPDLKVIATKHGSIFDEEKLALLIEMIKEKDYQIWIERVDENKLPAVIIEEGKVKQIRKKE